ncbi:unnamed protein product [Paramecium octaurelia]|uniref:Uncharacterized protein n=1 Tax=Paramecium octaurelia TaxID=43137 RepID=A0A8S1UX59_PAROT|nr:unnamed protein product [Paramecium octaurelia]
MAQLLISTFKDLRQCSTNCLICQECRDPQKNNCYHVCQEQIIYSLEPEVKEQEGEEVGINDDEEQEEKEEGVEENAEEMDETFNNECMAYCLQCTDLHSCLKCNVNLKLENKYCSPILWIRGLQRWKQYPYDGCYLCQYQCSFGCITCGKGNVCTKCDSLTILNSETAKCEKDNIKNNNKFTEEENQNSIIDVGVENSFLIDNLCGDGILNDKYEFCDVGNNVGDDGCSSICLIEENWNCEIQFLQEHMLLQNTACFNIHKSYKPLPIRGIIFYQLSKSHFNYYLHQNIKFNQISLLNS